jgi:hypothetical protein
LIGRRNDDARADQPAESSEWRGAIYERGGVLRDFSAKSGLQTSKSAMKLDEAERDLQLALYALACRELPDLSELGQVEDLVLILVVAANRECRERWTRPRRS